LDVNLQGLIVTSHLSLFSSLLYYYSVLLLTYRYSLLFTVYCGLSEIAETLLPSLLRPFGIGPTCMKPGTERRYVLIGEKVIRAGEAFLSLFVVFVASFSQEKRSRLDSVWNALNQAVILQSWHPRQSNSPDMTCPVYIYIPLLNHLRHLQLHCQARS
jgi:hypothetical protein